jgi:hypothetical protein
LHPLVVRAAARSRQGNSNALKRAQQTIVSVLSRIEPPAATAIMWRKAVTARQAATSSMCRFISKPQDIAHSDHSMKTLTLLALMSSLATAAIAADKVNFAADDTPATVLSRQTGQKVELHLKSGEKLSGKVQAVGTRTVHISGLTGQEFYDAVVAIDDIAAVVIRNDGK